MNCLVQDAIEQVKFFSAYTAAHKAAPNINPMNKSVSIITVNFNHHYVTEALLHSIFAKNKYPAVEIIVIDNGSKTNPVPLWQQQFPAVKFIRSEVNLGFAGGNNVGIKAATGDYIFLINNDTEVTENLIGELVHTLDTNAGAGMVSPKIRYYDKPDMLQYAGYTEMNYYTCRNSCIGQFETDEGQHDHRTGATGFAHGAAMMIKREAIEKAGPMAENFFLYYEEMDWCEYIKRAGYTVHLNMQALVYHKESISVGKASPLKEYFMNRNRLLFIRRNAPLLQKICFHFYFLLLVAPRNIILYIRSRNYRFIPILFKAIAWNFTHTTKSKALGYALNQ